MTKFGFAACVAILLASAFPEGAGYAQGPPPGQPYIQVPIPQIPGVTPQPRGDQNYGREQWEHCERLRDREHELRDRLAYAHGEDRARLEHRLQEVHYQRPQCRGCRL
jgi:hypothetical protein